MQQWIPEYSVGVRELDNQHKHLFELSNALLEKAQAANPDYGLISEMVSGLMDYSLYHISTEEEYMHKFECVSPEHLEQHKNYKTVSRTMLEKAMAAIENKELPAELIKDATAFITQWHSNHIVHMDKTYTKCFNDHGLDGHDEIPT